MNLLVNSTKIEHAGLFILIIFLCSFRSSTNNAMTGAERTLTTSDSVPDGRLLAIRYCQRCHLFPDPALLDKQTWVTSVLPNMGLRLGIRPKDSDPFKDMDPAEEKILRELNVYPESALLSIKEWESIVKYFEEMAPEAPLPIKQHDNKFRQLTQFVPYTIKFQDKPIPKTTLLKYDQTTKSFYVGDTENELFVLDSSLQLKDKWWIESPATDIDFPKDAPPRLLTIGVFKPSDQKLGRWMSLTKSTTENIVNIQSLPRPVQFTTGDLNMDGNEDVVFCGFGNNTGQLFWLDGLDTAKKHILKNLPGARKVDILDMNGDKKPDIISMTAQGREEMSIFFNQGNGKFKEKVIIRFPPTYGSSYYELADFNQDGFQDIIVTNGDNWDLSPIEKDYHGIRIYLNDKKNNFKKVWFYPFHGASKAIARDFDNDGDLDIVATSFYANTDQSDTGFVYLLNQGGLNFQSFITPTTANGKWLTMEAGDFDQDGDIDIILGSYFHTIGEVTKLVFKGITEFPQLLVLKNQVVNKKME